MKRFAIKSKAAICMLAIMSMAYSCKEKDTVQKTSDLQPSTKSSVKTAALGQLITFNQANQAYTESMAESDFSEQIKQWKTPLANIENSTLKITIPAGDVTQGFYSSFNIPEGTSYEVTFDMKFSSGFDFKNGGKFGFGFGTGDVWTGCDLTMPKGQGGSVRMMWNRTSDNRVIFKPYLYYTNMKDAESYPDNYNCGTNIKHNAFYPSTGSISSNTWYRMKIRITSNSGGATPQYNGRIQVKVGTLTSQTTILDSNGINWGYDWKRKVFQLLFDTFRGGKNNSDYQSNAINHIFYDNVRVVKDPTTAF